MSCLGYTTGHFNLCECMFEYVCVSEKKRARERAGADKEDPFLTFLLLFEFMDAFVCTCSRYVSIPCM